jgi:hypothetical protein
VGAASSRGMTPGTGRTHHRNQVDAQGLESRVSIRESFPSCTAVGWHRACEPPQRGHRCMFTLLLSACKWTCRLACMPLWTGSTQALPICWLSMMCSWRSTGFVDSRDFCPPFCMCCGGLSRHRCEVEGSRLVACCAWANLLASLRYSLMFEMCFTYDREGCCMPGMQCCSVTHSRLKQAGSPRCLLTEELCMGMCLTYYSSPETKLHHA